MFIAILIFVFLRPLISSLAFPEINLFYSSCLGVLLLGWIFLKKDLLGHCRIIAYPLLCFGLALAVSIALSRKPGNGLNEIYKYAVNILLLLFAASLSREELKKTLLCLAAGGVTVGCIAIYQYFFGFRHVLDYMAKEQIIHPFALDYISRKRVFLPFVTPNALAGYLIMVIPLMLIARRWVWPLLFLMLALALTQSLGALLAFFAGVALYLCMKEKRPLYAAYVLFGIITLAAGILMWRSGQPEHTQPLFSSLMRLNYWKGAWRIIGSSPLWGVGLGNFNLAQSRYAHNSYLQFWAETGIAGLVGLLWLIVLFFRAGLQRIRDFPEQQSFVFLALTVNTVFVLHNLVDFTFFLPEVSFLWWMTFGIMLQKDQKDASGA